MAKDTRHRIERLRERFGPLGIDGFYTEDPVHILYLTGFHAAETALLVGAAQALFVTDFRTLEEATERLPGFLLAEVDQGAGTLGETLGRLPALGVARLGFESNRLPYSTGRALLAAVGEGSAVPVSGLVEGLRALKEPGEVEALERSLRVAEAAFLALREEVRPGMTEKAIADRLETLLRENGARKGAFDACVLAGERASLPHGEPTPDRTLGRGEPLLVDFGAFAGRYASDITRMIYAGDPDPEIARIHEVVREAQEAAKAEIRPGVPAKAVDRAARAHVESAGYGHAFRHGLGHGVGLQVHEAPGVRWVSEDVLEAGNVFTVEPGIYLPGIGGVRLEDMVLVTATGCRTLTRLPAGLEASVLPGF